MPYKIPNVSLTLNIWTTGHLTSTKWMHIDSNQKYNNKINKI